MRFPLLRQAVGEHLVAGAGLVALTVVWLVAIMDNDDAGRFTALGLWTRLFIFVAPWFIAHRLIVRPYQDRSQDFLEALPVSRLRLVLWRLTLGATSLGVLQGAVWGFNWWWQAAEQAISASAALGVLCGMGLAVQALWAWAALGAYTGRYRFLFWFVLLAALVAVGELEWVPRDQIPLLRLIGPEAHVATSWPAPRALAEAATMVVGCHLLSIALAIHQDGALVRSLARPMSHGEMVGLGVGLVLLVLWLDELDSGKEKPPLALRDAVEADDGDVHVEVMRVNGLSDEAATATARHLAAEARALLEALQIPTSPPLLVLPQRGIDPGRSVIPTLRDGDGAAVVLSLPDTQGDTPWLRASLLRRLLVLTSAEAAGEERRWLLDGLATWWAARSDEVAVAQQWARAAALDISAVDLRRWLSTRERLGACQADALAFVVVQSAVEAIGEEELLAVARASLPPTKSPWEAWWRAEDPEVVLERRGLGLDALVQHTQEALAARREAGALAGRLVADAELRFVEPLGEQRRLEVGLAAEVMPEWWVRYYRLQPWSSDVSDRESRVDVVGGASTVRLPDVWLRGERVLVSVEAEDPALGCAMRLRSERLVVP